MQNQDNPLMEDVVLSKNAAAGGKSVLVPHTRGEPIIPFMGQDSKGLMHHKNRGNSGVSYTAFTYAGEQLPSCAFGFNSHGIVSTSLHTLSLGTCNKGGNSSLIQWGCWIMEADEAADGPPWTLFGHWFAPLSGIGAMAALLIAELDGAFSLNAIPPEACEVVPGGIGRNFVSRDLLEASSLEDALQVLPLLALASPPFLRDNLAL
eukprot:jgi/Mesen1/9313/ME000060S08753